MSPDRRILAAALRASGGDRGPHILRLVPIHEITEGMSLRIDPARRLVGTVVEVRDPSHAVAAAYGAVVVVVEYERLITADRLRLGTHYRITHTLWPHNEPQAWTVPWPATTGVTQRYADTTTTEENPS